MIHSQLGAEVLPSPGVFLWRPTVKKWTERVYGGEWVHVSLLWGQWEVLVYWRGSP